MFSSPLVRALTPGYSLPIPGRTSRALAAGICAVTILSLSACGSSVIVGVEPESGATVAVISGNNQEGTVGAPTPEPLVAEVTDEFGAPLGGITLGWTFQQGRGMRHGSSSSATQMTTVTDANGRSEVEWLLGTTAGAQQGTVEVVEDGATFGQGPAAAPSKDKQGSSKGKKVGFVARSKPSKPSTVEVNPDMVEVAPGSTTQLHATVQDEFGNALAGADVQWSSMDEAVATVDQSGMATAISEGSTQISAKTGPAEGMATVAVREGNSTSTLTVRVTPTSATIRGIGNTVQLTAEARDAANNLVQDMTFEWSSADEGIATVSQGGLVTAQALGNTMVVATLMCGSVACSDPALSSGSVLGVTDQVLGMYPNEPDGFTPWFEHDWQGTWPGDEETLKASGAGWVHGEANTFEIIDDPTAPHGKGRSLRHTQFAGQNGGNTGGTFNILSIDSEDRYNPNHVRLQDVYRSHWVYFEPDPETGDWQFGNTHMRTFWWNRLFHSGQGGFNTSLRSPADALSQRHSTFRGPRAWFYPDGDTSRSHSYLEVPATDTYHVGQWYHIETLIETEGKFGEGTAGQNNARIRIWVDGALKVDQMEQVWLIMPFINDHFGMVWLGSGTRAQDDYIRFGDIYISGRPY